MASCHQFGDTPGLRQPSTSNGRGTLAPIVRPQGEPRPIDRAKPSRIPPLPNQPKTPTAGFARLNSGVDSGISRAQEANTNLVRVHTANGVPRVLNQPSRSDAISGPASPNHLTKSSNASAIEEEDLLTIPAGPPTVGFFSARVADQLPQGENMPPPVSNLPIFNMHAESPSIRRTPGFDHKSSKPIVRTEKQVQAPAPAQGGLPRTNIINPQLESARRIGAPGSPSPMTNRGSYKPPTMTAKRTSDGNNASRTPLGESLGNSAAVAEAGGDVKRQRVNGA